jgi:iron complex outermembrane recepter protein
MKYLIWLCCLTLSLNTFSQKITGLVKDAQGKTLTAVSLVLQRARDSSVIKMSISHTDGSYEFDNIATGSYFISGTHSGFSPVYSSVFQINNDTKVPDLVMEPTSKNLSAVTVTSKKPLVEARADKIILNVEGSINATGSDALELLRKSPGVVVDRDDNINLNGKNGVQIFIDGRPTPLAGKDLAEYLKSLNSNSIEAIEIITNPSARYDAAGNAGIINIRLKKNKSFGTNGSLTGGYNIGIYPKYNGGISFNNRNRIMNVYGNYNYSSALNQNFMFIHREQGDTLFEQTSLMNNKVHNHNFKAGADYFINSRSTLGFIVNGTLADNRFQNYSRTPITYVPGKNITRILEANNTNNGERKNLNYNLNYRYSDTSGRELNADVDYSNYEIRINQYQPNFYFNSTNGDELYHVINNMIMPTDINIYTVKIDYDQPVKNGKLSVGGKSSFITTENKLERYDVEGNTETLDMNRSNFFKYTENIHALYINYNRQFKGWMIQAGLRMENTSTNGDSYPLLADGSIDKPNKQDFSRHYTNFFPSAAITFNKNPLSQWNFNFSRRIDRPAYQDLNPFEFKLDEYTFQKGNILLKPQYTLSFGATHTYKYKLNTTLNYSHITDVHTQLVDTTEKSKSFITKKNMATQDIISLNISYPLQLNWYSFFGNINSYYSHYKADFGPGRTVDLDVVAVVFYIQNSFRLGKGWTGEVSGWYVSPSIWQGFSRSRQMWSTDAGIQKTIFSGNGNMKVSVSDIFQSMRWKGVSNFAGQHIEANGGWESRLLKLSLTWRFGNTQVKDARQRKTGAEEETKRVNGDSDGRR